jgi:hypothetical protein
MPVDPLQALQAAQRPATSAATPTAMPGPLPKVLVAGAAGALGSEVVRRLVGTQRIGPAHVLVREPLQSGLRGVAGHVVGEPPIDAWPALAADIGVVLFDPPKLFFGRERALWVPQPADLVPLARWMLGCGVKTLAIVLPQAQGQLPEALKRGLLDLDEQAVAMLGFERLLILRTARKPEALQGQSPPQRLAAWMLSVFRFMVPASEQPVRASKVAELLDWALRLAPPGIHIAAPETVWRASQAEVREVAAQWLQAARA